MDSWQAPWKIFKKSFTVDTTQQPIYMMTRYRVGSKFATIAALYNLFLIRQRVIKNAIFLTKSNNPKIVKAMCFFVGSIYFVGLYCLWHIPSFFSQVAVRVYVSTEDAVTNILLNKYMQQILLNNSKINNVLKHDGLKI